MATTQRQVFIDWMKALGMLLIVIGHVIGSPHHMFNKVTQPIYTKQLGVAFFIFIMGWGLANQRGAWLRVVFNRAFPVYFYGVSIALILSVIGWFRVGDINESNYLPFIAGINVLFDFFPANPTTWYIGTYLHILLLWAVLMRRIQVTAFTLVLALVVEIGVRAALMAVDKNYIAYMLLPNWLGVFTLGYWLSGQKDTGFSPLAGVIFTAWMAGLALWALLVNGYDLDNAIPFRGVAGPRGPLAILLQSCAISLIYLVNTWVVFQLARRLFAARAVELVARNTLLIFIIHMPVIIAFSHDFYNWVGNPEIGRPVWIMVIFVGLALLSEMIIHAIDSTRVRNWLWNWLQRLLSGPAAVRQPSE